MRKSAKMHPKVAFSRQSALFAPKSPLGEKVRFGPKRRFWEIRVEFQPIWSGNSYGFVYFADFEFSVTQKLNFYDRFHISREFYQKVNSMSFYNFSRRVTENTLGFCHPSNAFQPQTKLPSGSLIFYPQNAFVVISLKCHQFFKLSVEFH